MWLQRLIWDVGRTGKITPTALLEPVEIGGATVKRATLNNQWDIERKKVKLGVDVWVRRSNDVIPEIMGVADESQQGETIEIPAVCPSCGTPLVQRGMLLYCPNYSFCRPQIVARIVHFASRDAMDIESLSDKTALQLTEKFAIVDVADLYLLQYEQLLSLEGWKEKKATNLLTALEKSKDCALDAFIYAIGIPNVGRKTARDLAKQFKTFEKFSGKDETNSGYMKLKSIDSGRLQVVYEDDDVIIINKPSGMLSQKAVPEDISANEYILSYLIRKGALSEEQFKTFKPSICNRLDRNTSGLLIAGKTLKGLQTMAEALKKRTVQKYYRCIVKGELREKTHLKGYLSKDEQNNKVKVVSHIRPEEKADYLPIETEYRPVAVSNGYTELEVHLITGRSHQIRAHLASIGHPIVGDGKYGDLRTNERFRKEVHVRSQLLHAYRIVLEDGREVIAPSGREFEDAWDYIQTSAF